MKNESSKSSPVDADLALDRLLAQRQSARLDKSVSADVMRAIGELEAQKRAEGAKVMWMPWVGGLGSAAAAVALALFVWSPWSPFADDEQVDEGAEVVQLAQLEGGDELLDGEQDWQPELVYPQEMELYLQADQLAQDDGLGPVAMLGDDMGWLLD